MTVGSSVLAGGLTGAAPYGRYARVAPPVTTAVILAAGEGSRLRRRPDAPPKPLTSLSGQTLLQRAIRSVTEAGVRDVLVVAGYGADKLIPHLDGIARTFGATARAIYNPAWRLGNGASALAAAPHVDGPFLLTMCDHVFAPGLLQRLCAADDGHSPLTLAVDGALEAIDDVDEATKVRIEDGRIMAIGKQLTDFDAVDTGAFVCRPPFFDALRDARAGGDHTVTGAVLRLVASGTARAIAVDGLAWQDVDTPADLYAAEAKFGSAVGEPASAG